ncbi:hypothetical protein GE061_014227 [Apolygus lucorum]|uniref:Zinc-finger domain-containing protein n=1 Tax=Apolygus lucorum TaxID=248454 RepID=A0A8S9XQ95_APOLU|nr:hypothetical protein GE061_014227 [Apolygus lucorum]
MKRRRYRDFFSEFKDGEIVKASELLPKAPELLPKAPPSLPTSPVKIKSRRSFKKRFSTPLVALQPRKSTRLSGKEIDYKGLDDGFQEPPIYRRKDANGRRYRAPRASLEPRDVNFNPDALSGTVCYTSQKVYSQAGTTCHQCRQKTIDLKSRCYSPYCRGCRGMFCGYCLLQRYGEDVAVVLRDPTWKCPPCRKICNCSICRRSYGKEPTGQLFPSVTEKGYSNVLAYLSQIGDDKLEENDADDESDNNEENIPPAKKIKYSDELSTKHLEPYVQLERLNLSFDEAGNLSADFKGF